MDTLSLLHLEHITGVSQDEFKTEVDRTGKRIRHAAEQILSETDMVEKNKDKLDLKSNLKFVEDHIENFMEGLGNILERTTALGAQEWIDGIKFINTDSIYEPQVLPEQAQDILMCMPRSLIELSQLKEIIYPQKDGQSIIPIPGYDEQGYLDPSKVEWIPAASFPRPGDHPTRLLVGISDGAHIWPTPIPPTVSNNADAVYYYQVHVLVHEFFHTVESMTRNPERSTHIILEVDGKRFTFSDWWKAFEELILSGIEPRPVSSYASTYQHLLNPEIAAQDPKAFTWAVAEQICETFVAYQLDIISNDHNWTSFQKESFGNATQLAKFIRGEAQSANLKWVLMDMLCRAVVINQ